jgi:glycosyltransferase involved in cell wall biosynthesis
MPSGKGISIVSTVRNEESHIREFLDSVSGLSEPYELIVVDAESNDRTGEIISSYRGIPDLKYIRKKCSRGEGRNIGASSAKYDYLLFLDGDCEFSNGLLDSYRNILSGDFDIVAGTTELSGSKKFSKLKRVPLYVKGFEVTSPSSNLCYSRNLFTSLGGFNPIYVTAEDIDLNIRAMRTGARATTCSECLVRAFTRQNITSFLSQAFWNGYGRGQLRILHRDFFDQIYRGERFGSGFSLTNLLRLSWASFGYFYALLKRGKYPYR